MLEKLIQDAEFIHKLKRGRMHSIAAKIAKEKVRAKIIAVTSSDRSPISKLADAILTIKATSTESTDEDSYLNTQLTGSYKSTNRTVFDIAATCVLEAIVSEITSAGTE